VRDGEREGTRNHSHICFAARKRKGEYMVVVFHTQEGEDESHSSNAFVGRQEEKRKEQNLQ